MKALRISPVDVAFDELVMVDKIIRISKSPDGDTAVIFLTDGSVIRVKDSVNNLEARLNGWVE